MIWMGIALIGMAVATIFGFVPIPKVLITLQFFGGLFLILWGYERRQKKRRSQPPPS